MEIYLKISILFTLGIIFFQDLKFRGIYWFLPMILLSSFFYLNYLNYGEIIVEILLYNIGIIMLFTSLLIIYFLVRYQKDGLHQIRNQIGLGDALFVFALTPAFLPQEFILFLTISFAVSLIAGVLMINLNKWKTIPLAGLQSFVLIILLTLNSNLIL